MMMGFHFPLMMSCVNSSGQVMFFLIFMGPFSLRSSLVPSHAHCSTITTGTQQLRPGLHRRCVDGIDV
jgi:hypothetical protein